MKTIQADISTSTCPICGNRRNHLCCIRANGVHYHKCLECEAIFNATSVVNSEFYSANYPQNIKTSSLLDDVFRSIMNRIKLKLIEKYYGCGNATLLDIGCGDGKFLASLPERFLRCGTDLNIPRRGNIYDKDIRDLDFLDCTFDICTAWHSLEHMTEPQSWMAKVRTLKKVNGVVFISVPNSNSLGCKYGKTNWFHLDTPRHLWLPNEKSMIKLATGAGMGIVDIVHPWYDFPLDLWHSFRCSPLRLIVYAFYPVFKRFDKETLVYVLN
jgi:SAM-dependent methyltransferase